MNLQQLCDLVMQLIENLQAGYSNNDDSHIKTRDEIKKITLALKKLNTVESAVSKIDSSMAAILINLSESLSNITYQKKQIEVMNSKLDMIAKAASKEIGTA